MLSNNFFKQAVIVLLLISIFSCSDKKEKIPVIDYQNNAQVLEIVKKYIDKDILVATGGMFDESGKQFIAVGYEINNSDEWGIKFSFLEKNGEEFVTKYKTDLLEGSFKESFFSKIKIPSFDYELVYYNSQSYYLGSGGGEIFSYIIDLENKQVYYAHLVVQSESSTDLFISDNTTNNDLKNFFILNFKKDYPNLKKVADDIVIE